MRLRARRLFGSAFPYSRQCAPGVALHWGNPDATSESSGPAVFNESNGYCVVMHLGDAAGPVRDEVGQFRSRRRARRTCPGAIGAGRQFELGQGIACGEKISELAKRFGALHYRSLAQGRTSQWRGRRLGERAGARQSGHGSPQSASHPHGLLLLECRRRERRPVADVAWVHAVHATARRFANLCERPAGGRSSRTATACSTSRRPGRMWIGGWYDNYRLSATSTKCGSPKWRARPIGCDWRTRIKSRSKRWSARSCSRATRFAVSPPRSRSTKAGARRSRPRRAAPKRSTGSSSATASRTWSRSDLSPYTLDAGRVVGEHAVHPAVQSGVSRRGQDPGCPGARSRTTIPEPLFRSTRPALGMGGTRSRSCPRSRNLAAMQAAGAGDVHYALDRFRRRRDQSTSPPIG